MVESLEDGLQRHRDLLWGVCYRMLGCPADADDALQATFEKVLSHPPPDEQLPLRPWLLRVAVNHCRDELRKQQTRKTAFWLPGPLETPEDDPRFVGAEAPDARYSRMESVSLAFMVALHALTPLQRAVLILRDVLDLSAIETADALETSVSSVKMALHRARAQVASAPLSPPLHDRKTGAQVLQALMIHLATHNVPALTELLTQDVRLCNDADPEQVAAHRVVYGRDKVLTFQFKTARTSGRFGMCLMNGQPALVAELASRRTPSSGRPIGQAAPDSSVRSRVLPLRVVFWIELDASGRVSALHIQTCRRKLSAVAFERLEGPSVRQLAAATWAALRYPPRGAWRRSAAMAGAAALVDALGLRSRTKSV